MDYKEPLYYDVWVSDHVNGYAEDLLEKLDMGKPVERHLEKLGEWEEHYLKQWGYTYAEPEEDKEYDWVDVEWDE